MVAKLLILLIRLYQLTLSPLLGNVCRFHPSCSNYGLKCLEYHGAIRGSWLTLRRLSRCHPFHPGGYDPPPPPVGREPAQGAGEPTERGASHAATPEAESAQPQAQSSEPSPCSTHSPCRRHA
ncbi:MAG: membrane protein insertion efficiency factor YidD [Polyangiaceae bacterium]|nr:membrane protein insertion efficiency factor YidD [Polyangiaceae bacterium]MCW5789153.1 membrane protein insertion efficiency factor YidD [Polyangiaceae bacterium]